MFANRTFGLTTLGSLVAACLTLTWASVSHAQDDAYPDLS